MTILKDITDTLKDAINIAKELDISLNKQTSIAKMSSDATLQFPVIISRSINVDTSQTVTKALERQYAIFIQMIISMNPYLDLEKDRNLQGYIKKNLHQNTANLIDLNESAMDLYTDMFGNTMLFSLNEGCSGQVLASNREQMFNPDQYLNNKILNNLYTSKNISLESAMLNLDYFYKSNPDIITEAKNDDKDEDELDPDNYYGSDYYKDIEVDQKIEGNRIAKEKNLIEKKKLAHQKVMDRKKLQADQFDQELAKNKEKLDRKKFAHQQMMDREKLRMNQHEIEMDRAAREADDKKFKHELNKTKWDYQSKTMTKLSDNDVKKCNELVPTTLSVTLQIKDGSSFGGVSNFIIGVKGLMHPVNSDDMISNLLSGFKSGNKFFNFLRWTSGEIKFMKDLILNMDNIREDVIKKHKKNGSSWWGALKRRRNVAALRRIKGSGRILPNATIVCSMTEVNELKEAYGMDLMNSKIVQKIMKSYFLLGFAVVDDSQELCHFIFDGEDKYQVVSFSGLEKENNSKNDFKDIYKLINSGRL